jgi:hypothetical protein
MVRILPVLVAAACWGAPLDGLRPAHPRLMALDSDIARLREVVRSDARAGALYAAVKKSADAILEQSPVVHRLIGPRLLDQSRRALDRVYTLALVYRMEGGARYLERALKELRTAAAFPDWNPSHFLDTAEMTHALAIGYDWLYPALAAEDRALLRKAIVEKGLDPGIQVYKSGGWWSKSAYNWNQVCNGGMTIGALAIAEDERERAAYIVGRSVESIKLAMASYAPDGGWAEGPGYWHYATRYNVYYLAALESALGTDFGLPAAPGFSRAGEFRIYCIGPTGMAFNYADAGTREGGAEEMFWLARKFSNPVYAGDELERLRRPHALDLVWYQPSGQSPKQAGWPLAKMYQGVDVGFLRTAWEDPKATWIGIKGGDNQANHGHLDLGSFVLEAGGVRWAADLGSDDYNLPGYFGKSRWTYYRLKTESHNTVLIDGENQNPKAKASMRLEGTTLRIDMSQAYAGKLESYTREATLRGASVVIRDTIAAARPVEALWGMVTQAQVETGGARATLRQDGAELRAEIRSPEGAQFGVVDAAAPPPQRDNRGAKKLVVRLPGKTERVTIEVALTPAGK